MKLALWSILLLAAMAAGCAPQRPLCDCYRAFADCGPECEVPR